MNNGAFGENFPYSNFHDLNMDWIIKIAKDFLDQYTHIQQVIEDGETSLQNLTTEGLQQLQEKADNLESLLQAWYDEHSADIADQLADALNDLNNWYTIHQNYLDQTLENKIAAFNTAADNKAAETIASIPDDYTTLSNNVFHSINQEDWIRTLATKRTEADIKAFLSDFIFNGVYDGYAHEWTESATRISPYMFLQFPIEVTITTNNGYQISRWVSNSVLTTDTLSNSGWVTSLRFAPYSLGTLHIRKTDNSNISTSEFSSAINIQMSPYKDMTLTELEYGANAKLTGDTIKRNSLSEIIYNTILPYQLENIINSNFIQGVFDEGLFYVRETNLRLTLPAMIKTRTKFTLNAKPGYQLIRDLFSNSLVTSYISNGGWVTSVNISPNTYNIINVRKTDGTEILANENPIYITAQERFNEPIDFALTANATVKSVAHRGYSYAAPENTIPAYISAANHGFSYIESDVTWTSDFVPVMLHDSSIDRTSNGTGNIYDLTYSQIENLDFGSWFNSSFAGTRIPTFEDYIYICKVLNVTPYIEIKVNNVNAGQTQIQELIDIVNKYGMSNNVIWTSYGHGYLEYIYNHVENAKVVYLFGWFDIDTSIEYLETKYPTAGMQFINTELTQTIIDKLVAKNIPIAVAVYDTESDIINMPPEISTVLSNKLNATTILYSYHTK